MGRGKAVFVDTTIQIARMIHADQVKRRISDRLATYDLCAASLVVKQEFKRRFLEEVLWCLNKLSHPSNPMTYEDLLRHVTDFAPQERRNEAKIRQKILLTVDRGPTNDRTERAKRLLRTMLRTALAVFDDEIGHVFTDSGCGCAAYPVVEVKPYKRYDLRPIRCTECGGRCGIEQFMTSRRAKLVEILEKLSALPASKRIKADGTKTELGKMEEFLGAFLAGRSTAVERNPCLTVGDLVIALESAGVPDFYTMNGRESQFLCRWMGQTMILRKTYHVHDDVVCADRDPAWPAF